MKPKTHSELEHILNEIETEIEETASEIFPIDMKTPTDFSYERKTINEYLPIISELQERIEIYQEEVQEFQDGVKETINEIRNEEWYKSVDHAIKEKSITATHEEYKTFWEKNKQLKEFILEEAPKKPYLNTAIDKLENEEEFERELNPLEEVYEQIQAYNKLNSEIIPLKKELNKKNANSHH